MIVFDKETYFFTNLLAEEDIKILFSNKDEARLFIQLSSSFTFSLKFWLKNNAKTIIDNDATDNIKKMLCIAISFNNMSGSYQEQKKLLLNKLGEEKIVNEYDDIIKKICNNNQEVEKRSKQKGIPAIRFNSLIQSIGSELYSDTGELFYRATKEMKIDEKAPNLQTQSEKIQDHQGRGL